MQTEISVITYRCNKYASTPKIVENVKKVWYNMWEDLQIKVKG